jgi:hypothetical protein
MISEILLGSEKPDKDIQVKISHCIYPCLCITVFYCVYVTLFIKNFFEKVELNLFNLLSLLARPIIQLKNNSD